MMEHPRQPLGSMEEIPEDLRCKRSDGKQWRCSALSMPDKTVCEKHYIQAKKRAANSALRASLKKARRAAVDNNDVCLQDKHNDPEMLRPLSPNVGGLEYKRYRGKFGKSWGLQSSEVMGVKGSMKFNHGERDVLQGEEYQMGSSYTNSYLSKERSNFDGAGLGEYYEKSSCHQCGRSDGLNVVWCISCDRKGYCGGCLSQWYADIPVDDIRQICPACRGICNCKVCLSGDNLIKTKVQEIGGMDKLRYLHSLLSFLLPVLKQIYSEQCFEIAVETRVHGMKTDIPRANVHVDEQMCCNLCKVPIFDFHRHCQQCSYDLCLTCCRDIRKASLVSLNGESAAEKMVADKLILHPKDDYAIDYLHLSPKWKANSDGTIPCAPDEVRGCGSSKLVLRRILKINWVAKLVKNAEEMVTGCKVSEFHSFDNCASCTGGTSSLANDFSDSMVYRCSHRDDSDDNILYYPTSENLKRESINHFRKHWVKGEPIIVKHVFDHSLSCSWDPMSIWRGIQETADERTPENNTVVKAIDYLKQSEVDIELSQFIKGYSEGLVHEDGRPKMLILKDWPPPTAWEEFILCQRPEFLTNLPLVEFIHPKWGLLNLASKLPHDNMQTEAGPKIYISYGSRHELGRGDPVTNLRINMGDMVYLLMHSIEVSIQGTQRSKLGKTRKTSKESDGEKTTWSACSSNSDLSLIDGDEPPLLAHEGHAKQKECGIGFDVMEGRACNGNDITSVEKKRLNRSHFGNNSTGIQQKISAMEGRACNGNYITSVEKKRLNPSHFDNNFTGIQQKISAGATWDVFRRQDVPKLNEFLRVHWEEFATYACQPVTRPVYEQALYINKHHRRKLKEEYGIEPWTFEQHVGEAVFIPAGCPYQVRNLQSTVQLALDFLSPESLNESMKMVQDIRCLPDDHDAKINMWEVGKMSLYAASSAIREIQKIVLDPKLSSNSKFEDRKLTAMVAENLEKIRKRRSLMPAGWIM